MTKYFFDSKINVSWSNENELLFIFVLKKILYFVSNKMFEFLIWNDLFNKKIRENWSRFI